MTTGVSPSNSITQVSIFSISNLHSLVSKVNRVFGFYLVAVASFCLYHVVRSCQFFMTPSSQLDDKLKAVKCKLLLHDMQSVLNQADVPSLVKECEALHRSMTDKDPTVAMGLFEYYFKNDPVTAYLFAWCTRSEEIRYKAFQFLWDNNSKLTDQELSSLLNKAYKTRIAQENQTHPLDEVKRSLEYVKHANSLGQNGQELKNKAWQRAMDFANKCQDGLVQADAWSEIEKVWNEVGIDGSVWETEQFKGFLAEAKKTSENANLLSVADAFKAHSTLAKASSFCELNPNGALSRAHELFDNGFHQDADLLAWAYAERGYMAKNVLQTAFNALPYPANAEHVRAYLRLANSCQKHGMEKTASEALAMAIVGFFEGGIRTDEEIEIKIGLLKEISRCEAMSQGLDQKAAKIICATLRRML